MKITGRSSSITNAFINAIIPIVSPTSEQICEALEVLELDALDVRCVYCGDPSTEWDHLNPLVKDKKPTGYVSELANLVPACGKCNQSKGNKNWRSWMLGAANRSPNSRNIPDIDRKIARIESYQQKYRPSRHDFGAMIGEQLWTKHWDNWQRILDMMKEAQIVATEINTRIRNASKEGLQ